MSSAIKVFKYGLHRGEERLVVGNLAAGMVNFSGCHLACSFCYTPETSVHKLGTDMTEAQFSQVLLELKLSGAQNINLISPTHLWKWIEPALAEFHDDKVLGLPLVLKISGYESAPVLQKMARIADVFVPDFKVWQPDLAASVKLPRNYGAVALAAIAEMSQSHRTTYNADGRLSRGVLVRHLMMPGRLEDSKNVVEQLGRINFAGVLNLMTQFFDPQSNRLIAAPLADIDSLVSHVTRYKFSLLVDGKPKETPHA